MTASVTHASHQGQRNHQVRTDLLHFLEPVARVVMGAASAFGRVMMRWAVAYERTAHERIMRELALSHPSLVAEIRAARAAAAVDEARRSPVTGLWE